MSKRLMCVLLCVVMCVSVLSAGCGSQNTPAEPDTTAAQNSATEVESTPAEATSAPAKPVKIRFANSWPEASTFGKVFHPELNKFMSDHKDTIEIVSESVSGDELNTKVKVEAASGQLSDVFGYWGNWSNIQHIVDPGLLLDIDEYVKLSSEKDLRARYSDAVWSLFSYKDGKTYGIPLVGFTSLTLCNKELFKKYNLEYPKTYDDLLAVSKVFNENGIIPLAQSSKGGNPGHFFISSLIAQYPTGIDTLTKIKPDWSIDYPDVLNALKLIKDMKDKGVLPKDTISNGDWGPHAALYDQGKAAMIYTQSWMISAISPELAENSEIIPFPQIPGGRDDYDQLMYEGANFGAVINKKSFEDTTKTQAIVDFMDFLSSDDFQRILVGIGEPAAKMGVNFDTIKVPPLLSRVLEDNSKKKVIHLGLYESYPASEPYFTFAFSFDELFSGAITPEQCLKKGQDALDAGKEN